MTDTISKTKIVATLGPACMDNDATLAEMIHAGARIFRINFSHGNFDQYRQWLNRIEALREQTGQTLSVFADLAGPKIRTSEIYDEGTYLQKDETVTIYREDQTGSSREFGSTYPGLIDDVNPGQEILIDDGTIVLAVKEKHPDSLTCRVLQPGQVHSRKGINLPDTEIRMPSITQKDWQCVNWAIENNLDAVSVSFVRTADEIRTLKNHLRQHHSHLKIIAKIEKPQAVENLDPIAREADALMVARGDLGVEMDLAKVPLIQKRVIHLARRLGRPCIVATQVLQSMIENHIPTRAEVSDAANAVFDMTDALMLSGETAVGKFPVSSVRWLARTAKATESWLDDNRDLHPEAEAQSTQNLDLTLTAAAAQIADRLRPKALALRADDLRTAALLSNARIDCPILAFTADPHLARWLNMHYGLVPLPASAAADPAGLESLSQTASAQLIEHNLAAPGDTLLMLASQGKDIAHPDSLLIRTVE